MQPATVDSQQTCDSQDWCGETYCVKFVASPAGCSRFYLSDVSSESDSDDTVSDNDLGTNINPTSGVSTAIPTPSASMHHLVPAICPLKCCKLEVPACVQCKMSSVRRLEALTVTEALDVIKKLLKSKKTQFVAGLNGLQVK